MKPESRSERLLLELYDMTRDGSFASLYELEIKLGIPAWELRSLAEDLKNRILVDEHPEGFQISREGIQHATSRWV